METAPSIRTGTAPPRPVPEEQAAAARARGLPERVAALLDPATYPHPAADIELVETHISWVVLAGSYAYKMKKPVDFGFLDFRTLAQREHDCAEEVRLNRRLCRGLYRGVEHLVERGGVYRIGGPGRLVEPLVWMRRLPAEGMLPHLLRRFRADAALMRRLARRLSAFHARAATGPGVDEHGSPEVVAHNWRENFEQMAPFVGRTTTPATNEAIRAYVDRFLDAQGALLARRVARGRIRDGHGDLHAGSVCLDGHRLYLFDCLEFNARFRCADVASEVSFLAMDLDRHGRADLGAAFVDGYVGASGDRELLDLLDFYRCYRAYVRGKVLSFRLAEPELPASEASAIAVEASGYFDLAASYADRSRQPQLIVVMGLPASGKTTLAAAIAGRLGAVHISSDVVRKTAAGIAPTTPRTAAFGAGLYTAAARHRTYDAMRASAARWLRRGKTVVLDATFGDPAERRRVQRLAGRLGMPLAFLACQAAEPVLVARLRARRAGPSVSDARLENWPALRDAYQPPREIVDVVAIDTQVGPATAVEAAMRALGRRPG